MSDDDIVRDVVSRLSGEVWYRDKRPHRSDVMNLPFTVFTDPETYYYIGPKGVRGDSHSWPYSRSYDSADNAYERCSPPVFPLSPDVWDYEVGHWRQ